MVDKIRIIKDANGYLILYPGESGNYIGYRYTRYRQLDINSDTWRLTTINVYDSSLGVLHKLCPSGYDVEGVLKIQGETDYVGSVHGDEQYTDMFVFVNGFSFNTADTIDAYVDSVEFIVKSNIYHADSPNLAFIKTKSALFDKEGVHIKNRWRPLQDTSLVHVRGCLLSVNKMSTDIKLINTYRDSNVNAIPQNVPNSTTQTSVLADNPTMTDFTMVGDFLIAKLWTGERGGSSNSAQVVDFGTRIKPYIDCYVNETIPSGRVIKNDTNFLITTI